MHRKVWIDPCALLVALCLMLGASSVGAGEVAADLREVLDSAGPGERIPVVILMQAFPDQHDLLEEARAMNPGDRRSHVIARMRGLAQNSQHSLRASLVHDSGTGDELRVLWGVNGIALDASPALIERVAVRDDVRWVLYDRPIDWREAIGVDLERVLAERPPWPGAGDGPTGGDASGPNPGATVAPEVIAMGAKQVWDELGYTGNGVIVGVIDSGIDRNHPDLADHIWTNLDEIPGNSIDDDDNGFIDDTWGWDFCSNDNDPSGGSHGTQVAGQVAGDGTNGTVTGMAPDAELMALGINCGGPSTWWQASDYAIANGAHLMTQSYSLTWVGDPHYEAFRRQTDTELAAGLIHLNSSGNTGLSTGSNPVPYNVTAPASCPPPWLHPDQTVGGGVSSLVATANINWGSDVIDATSPYGPSAWEDIQANTDPAYPHTNPPEYLDYPYENGGQLGLLKPDIAAYGDGTSTTCPGTGYCGFGGTSSSTPHTAGVVALMMSSNPGASPEFIAEALLSHAQPRGVPGKNNRYGVGLVQAYSSVVAVESAVVYDSHTVDDGANGNGDGAFDPGEQAELPVTLRNLQTSGTISGIEAVLSSSSPGVTIHNHHVTFPPVVAGGVTVSNPPHFSASLDPGTCGNPIEFEIELRFDGKVRRTTVYSRAGTEQIGDLLNHDFESSSGWTSDPGTTSRGAFVREDPIGVLDASGTPANPEDDTTPAAGVTCWVTGNGELNGKKDENNNDVDGGSATLISPVFGVATALSLDLVYDRWYYDNSSGGDSFRAEITNDGGSNWVQLEQFVNSTGGWGTHLVNLQSLLPLTDNMRLRFVVSDTLEDTAVEGAVDEVRVGGRWVTCNDYTPGAALAPNPVGNTLRVGVEPAGHTLLSWDAPAVDGGHDAATLYRVERAGGGAGPFVEVGSATDLQWVDVDALAAPEPYFYRVKAENVGGSE